MASSTTTGRRSTARRPDRREQLLRAALELFRARGYHGTGINDIGEAAGVTGPAIYRHFETKDDILVAAIMAGATRMGEAALAVLQADMAPRDALAALCTSFVEVATDDPDLIAVYLFEARHLPRPKLAPLRRGGRMYVEEYVNLLTVLRPELSDAEAGVIVRGALFLGASACLDDPGMERDRLCELLADRMLAALLAPS